MVNAASPAAFASAALSTSTASALARCGSSAAASGVRLQTAPKLKTLRRLPDLGVDFIDTADSYGPDFSEELIREALACWQDPCRATKGGLARTGPNIWIPLGRPGCLIQQAHTSRWRLGVETISLWQLHRIDSKVPAKEQFDAIASLLNDKVIRCAGLSEVSVAEIEAARRVFPVATVQNRYNFIDRASEAALDYCAKHAIGFIPWAPLDAGASARPGSALDAITHKHRGRTPGQIALAWLLKRSPVMLPIPGTGKQAHLRRTSARRRSSSRTTSSRPSTAMGAVWAEAGKSASLNMNSQGKPLLEFARIEHNSDR